MHLRPAPLLLALLASAPLACGGGASTRPSQADAAVPQDAPLQLDVEFQEDAAAPEDSAPPPDLTPAVPQPQGPPGSNWGLVFDDEFVGTTIDALSWAVALPWSPTVIDNQLQYYAPDDVVLDGSGILKLTAELRSMNGQSYTSGAISSFNRFGLTFGVVEARIKVPKGSGFWPTFWMLPTAANSPELDVMEASGTGPASVLMNLTWGATVSESSGTWYTLPTGQPDFTADFHVFTLWWSATALVWYIDGVEHKRYTTAANIPQQEMYLLLSFAIGSGGFTQAPDVSTPFPSSMEIDYVRAWQP